MKLSPRYGTEPLIRLAGFPPGAIAEPAVRQRRRLAAALGSLTDEQWDHPSRCAGWTARDVVVHLDSTNTFWTYSIRAGLRGEPTRFLADFDPAASPAAMVAASRDVPVGEVLDRFTASTEALCDSLGSVAGDDWSALAEAPPGHLSVEALVHHALWDAWVHERDIMLPLGQPSPEEADEVAACLRYVVALSPAFSISQAGAGGAVLTVAATDPETSLVVEVGHGVEVRPGTAPDADVGLEGDAVGLVEALSVREPLDAAVTAETVWLVDGLARAFDMGQP
ncbi:MAG: maleylpyruvate isomerase family mycothiol-dependent enzyme [Acidimicrobiia bacterium]